MATSTDEKNDGAVGLLDQPLVVEGKRQRKTVESFSIEHEAKPTAKYEGGKGVKLGEIPYTEHQIIRHSAVELRPMHRLCLDRPGTKTEIKKNLREFSGFTFSEDSDTFKKKRMTLLKLSKSALGEFLDILGLQRSGTKEDIVDRILSFLLEPQDTGKEPAAKKRKRSTSGVKKKPAKSTGGTKRSKRSSKAESTDEEDDVSFDENEDEEDRNEADEEDEITAPTDDELKESVGSILEGADLHKVTVNSVCKQVFEKYPGVDLSAKKDFIKQQIQKTIASSESSN